MTHDTPDGTDERRRWCESCQLSVEAATEDGTAVCPACGGEL
jgi:predicted RNA-binding Zn-ribbon protein involved in translation (DUF1610 family)